MAAAISLAYSLVVSFAVGSHHPAAAIHQQGLPRDIVAIA